jgi:hypothetical protein
MKMKFVIRRAIVSIVLSPFVVLAYAIGYAVLVGLGAEPTTNLDGVLSNGWLIATVAGVAFTIWPKVQEWVGGTN